MQIIEFDLGTGRCEGEVVVENKKTVRVKIRRAGKSKIIKRHKVKHRVRFVE